MQNLLLTTASIAILFAPFVASAHEHQTFRIGGKTYDITIGSLNEPVTVDDKSGVDFTIVLGAGEEEQESGEGHEHTDTATPVTGLEQTLKVELSAGDKKKTLDLSPQYGKPGSYKAVFFPTVATTLTYRVFGIIEGTNVDLSFTCNPAGHPQSPEDTTELAVSDGVTRLKKSGAFGCPGPKEDLGFPEPSLSILSVDTSTDKAGSGTTGNTGGYALGIVALALSIIALVRSRRAPMARSPQA